MKLFLVVLYNKAIGESCTIKTLIDYISNLEHKQQIKIVIWNNGPEIFCDETFGANAYVELIQDCTNKPLSFVYNSVYEKFKPEYFAIFDDDTELTCNYIEDMLRFKKIDAFLLPKVTMNYSRSELGYDAEKLKYPKVNGLTVELVVNSNSIITAPMSGVLLSKGLCNNLRDSYGDLFDQDFSLYGVDTVLFTRIAELGLAHRMHLGSDIKHSDSFFLDEPDEKKRAFRRKEHSIARGILIRKYYFKQYRNPIKRYIKLLSKLISAHVFASKDARRVYSGFYVILYFFLGRHKNSLGLGK
ncbi:MAG: hypothetical protein ACRCYV_00450 [Aeromonas sp.]